MWNICFNYHNNHYGHGLKENCKKLQWTFRFSLLLLFCIFQLIPNRVYICNYQIHTLQCLLVSRMCLILAITRRKKNHTFLLNQRQWVSFRANSATKNMLVEIKKRTIFFLLLLQVVFIQTFKKNVNKLIKNLTKLLPRLATSSHSPHRLVCIYS